MDVSARTASVEISLSRENVTADSEKSSVTGPQAQACAALLSIFLCTGMSNRDSTYFHKWLSGKW